MNWICNSAEVSIVLHTAVSRENQCSWWSLSLESFSKEKSL